MNKKISFGLCLSLVIIAVASTFAITMVFSKQIYNSIISNISQRSQTYDSAEEINRLISNYFYGDLEEYNNSLGAALAKGYVSVLNDDSSYYMSASEYASYTDKLENGLIGIGIDTIYDYSRGDLVVSYVYEGSSAESEGLEAGDLITAVNNITVTRSNYQKLSAYFTGVRMSLVTIEYQRGDVTSEDTVMNTFNIPTVVYEEVNGIGYVRISGFYKNTENELKSALESLKNSGVENVVFDVRNTSEGTVEYAAKTIDVVVPNISGNIAVAKDKTGNVIETFSAEYSEFPFAYAVLVNSGTKGPAELFACDLRDIKQAQLIGTATAGVGTMQKIYNLDDGSAISLSVALVIPKNGETAVYDKIGVTPTLEVSSPVDDYNIALVPHEEDTQLTAAINLFQNN